MSLISYEDVRPWARSIKNRTAAGEMPPWFIDKNIGIQRYKDEAGKLPINVRWVDTNEQDESNPKYRSRLVAKDFKKHSDPELYTATPPMGMLRWVISVAATGLSRKSRTRKVMINDVARAYFNAPSLSPTFVDICDEDFEKGDEGMCGS